MVSSVMQVSSHLETYKPTISSRSLLKLGGPEPSGPLPSSQCIFTQVVEFEKAQNRVEVLNVTAPFMVPELDGGAAQAQPDRAVV